MPSIPIDLPTEDDTAGYGNPALLAEAERLARRKAELQQRALLAARQQGVYAPPAAADAQGGFTSAVTGTPVAGLTGKTPALAHFVPAIAQGIDRLSQNRLDTDVSGFNRREAAVAQKHLSMKPPDDAPANVKLQWAQRGTLVPSLKPTMDAYVQDEIIKAPERRAAVAWDKTKFALEHGQKAADAEERRRHNLAVEGQGHYAIAQDGSIKINTRTGETTLTGVKPRPTPAQEKTEQERKTKVENFDTVIRLVNDAVPYLDKLNPGLAGVMKDMWTTVQSKSTDSTKAAKALDVFAENLKPYYNRPPGDPTGKEVENWGKAMGDLNNRFAHIDDRKAAAATVIKIMTDQKNRVSGAPVDDLRGTLAEQVNALMKERGGEPTGAFVGDPTAAINAMTDPVEQEMARRAYANQKAGNKAPKRSVDDILKQYPRR